MLTTLTGECEITKKVKCLLAQFLVAPPLPSGATYLVTTASVCMYGCSLVVKGKGKIF